MYVPAHIGSIRVATQIRRYEKNLLKAREMMTERTKLIDSVVIMKPENEDENWTAPPAEEVIYGWATGFRIRQSKSNKFVSVAHLREKLEFLDGCVAEHEEEMNDARAKISRLIGAKESTRLLDAVERRNRK